MPDQTASRSKSTAAEHFREFLERLRGAPVELAQCETIDMPCIADAEIVLEAEPWYYQDIAAHFADYDFQTVARALGKLHVEEKLWQDVRGRICLRGSAFTAEPPAKSAGTA